MVTAEQGAAGETPRWSQEAMDTLRLAWPIALTQLGQVAMMTSDLAMIGRLGDEAVAAASLAHAVLFTVFVTGMGLVSAVAPLAAQGFGGRDPRRVRRATRVGIWAAVLLGIPLSLGQLWGEELLVALGQTPQAAALAERYLLGLAWCLVPAWVFIALRGFMGAVNRPEPALWITLAAVPANALLAYGLIYGAAGLPKLDLLGAGLATTIVNILMCAAAIWFAQARQPFRKYHVFGHFWRFDAQLMRKLLVVGLPISGAFLLEVGLFAAAALMIGQFGTNALAAHQIAVQMAAIMFMVPFGISMAATVRVGHAVGRRDPEGTRRAGFTAIAMAAAFMGVMTLLVLLARYEVPRAFLGAAADHSHATVDLVGLFLVCGAAFFVFDGIQTTATGALRGLNDTRFPLLMALIGFWLVGFGGACLLAFIADWGPVGIWIGLSLGLTVFSLLVMGRFHLLTRRKYLPS
jgi:MATE family multidrug resistance protein